MKKLYLLLFLPYLITCALLSADSSFSDFDVYQSTINKETATKQLATYLENGNSCKDYYTISNDAFYLFASPADKQANKPEFVLTFGTKQKPTLPTFTPDLSSNKPLTGLRIALDPGHVGGKYARAEERYIDLDIQTPEGIKAVQFDEGTLAVATAKILADLLTEFGATVLLTKEQPGQSVYPVDFETWCKQQSLNPAQTDFRKTYNGLDLIARAEKINAFEPHVTLMIHYNGGDRYPNGKNIPTSDNHCLMFTPGSFAQGELAKPEARYEFIRLLVTESAKNSEEFSKIIAKTIEQELGIPLLNTSLYMPDTTKLRVPGVYARNLALTRRVRSTLCYGETLLQDNIEEAQRLAQTDVDIDGIQTSSRVVAVAKAYFKGICRFFGIGN